MRRRDASEQKGLQDIIKLIKEYDPDCLPTFVAKNLNKLPPITFDHIDVTTFLKEMSILKRLESNHFTFMSESSGSQSWLDYCLTTCAASQTVTDVKILYDVTWSDHYPICITCCIPENVVPAVVTGSDDGLVKVIGEVTANILFLYNYWRKSAFWKLRTLENIEQQEKITFKAHPRHWKRLRLFENLYQTLRSILNVKDLVVFPSYQKLLVKKKESGKEIEQRNLEVKEYLPKSLHLPPDFAPEQDFQFSEIPMNPRQPFESAVK
ncbi:unnamed protein product, partial [Leptidea sinapis]